MKKSSLKFAFTASMALACWCAMAQEARKAPEAGKRIMMTTHELKVARIDSSADYQKFRNEAGLKINRNQEMIAELKSRKAKETQEERFNYDSEILTLEYKNDMLNTRIKDSIDTKTTNWSVFKREFNHDVSELENAIKRFRDK